MVKCLKVGDIIKPLALVFILLGSIILKYMLKPKTQHKNIPPNQQFNKKNEKNNQIEQEQKEPQDKLSDVFANKGSIFLMISLFLIFIIIIILIALRRFFK